MDFDLIIGSKKFDSKCLTLLEIGPLGLLHPGRIISIIGRRIHLTLVYIALLHFLVQFCSHYNQARCVVYQLRNSTESFQAPKRRPRLKCRERCWTQLRFSLEFMATAHTTILRPMKSQKEMTRNYLWRTYCQFFFCSQHFHNCSDR